MLSSLPFFLRLVIAGLAAALTAFALTPRVRRFAWAVGAVDQPGARRVNTRAVPRMGGLAIVAGFVLAVPLVAPPDLPLLGTLVGGLVIAILGAADDLLDLLGGVAPRGVVVDPSAASFLTELRQRGLPVLAGDNRVADGIRAVGELLQREELVFAAECTNTVREFQSYVWDEGAAALGVDRPVKENDHCMDAVRYFVMTVVKRGCARARRRPKGL